MTERKALPDGRAFLTSDSGGDRGLDVFGWQKNFSFQPVYFLLY